MRMTPEEVEVRVWAFVVVSITIMVLTIGIGLMYLVGFEPQDPELAPIDAVFLEILKAIAFMGVGTLGGIAGRKSMTNVAHKIAEKQKDEDKDVS
jgi:predicted membrane protein